MPEPNWSAYLWSIKDQVQLVCYIALFVLSLLRGAAPERILSGILLAMLLGDRIHHLLVGGSIMWRHANVGHIVIDLIVMGATFAVALQANRIYPLWIAGAQIIAIFGHLYRLMLSDIIRWAYDMMAVMPSYIQLAALASGLACHMWRRTKRGSYPSWRRSLPPPQGRAPTISPAA